jgi:glycosyltransferase involved in cell wall biosynthesis
LRALGHAVIEIHSNKRGVLKYIELSRALLHERKAIDCLIVGFPGPQAVILAKFLYRGPIIFNGLLSLYDAVILDRKVYSRFGVRALYFWVLDYLAAHLADVLVLDCDAYIDFFQSHFFVPREKCTCVFLGAQEQLFTETTATERPYEIHYWSSFIPTHGTSTIIRAAKLVEESGITFVLSGAGQTLEADRKLAHELNVSNVTFVPRFSGMRDLQNFISSSWVCLGLFGKNERTPRCIGSKVFEELYLARPVVTNNTQATQELLRDGESALLVPPEDPEALAQALRTLQADDALRRRIATAGKAVYDERASEAARTEALGAVLQK